MTERLENAKATSCWSLTGHAGLHKQWPRLYKHHNHWWKVLGVRIRPRNQIPVFNENLRKALNTTSHKCCLPSTDANNAIACVWRFKVVSCKRASLKSTRFYKKIYIYHALYSYYDMCWFVPSCGEKNSNNLKIQSSSSKMRNLSSYWFVGYFQSRKLAITLVFIMLTTYHPQWVVVPWKMHEKIRLEHLHLWSVFILKNCYFSYAWWLQVLLNL